MGFEPMQLALVELESTSLDHSDTDAALIGGRSQDLTLTKRTLYQLSYKG